MEPIKPTKLNNGDTVAVISPSWGGPHAFPETYEFGIKRLREVFDLKIKEYPTTRASDALLSEYPEKRAADINHAFADKEVKAIIASIGGEDSVRILPFLDTTLIMNNPKIFMGYSDTTTLLTYLNQLGLVTFHGPSVMAGFAEQGKLKAEFIKHLHEILFNTNEEYVFSPYSDWTQERLEWADPLNLNKYRKFHKNEGWHFIQGSSVAEGRLFGGNIEVLEFMKGTSFWPSPQFWKNKILFFETSEEKPSIDQIKRILRNSGLQNVFNNISALLFGRARDYSNEEKKSLEEMIVKTVAKEFKNYGLPIVTNMDFGHTDPQIILPLGAKAQVNCANKSFKLLESPLK